MDSTPQKHHKPPAIHPQTPPAAAVLEEDRINNLPDSILSHILSKLPTKTAIAAAVLSTKWKHLFASIPNLSLLIDEAASNTPRPSPNFVNFMYHLLTVTLRDVTRIEKFALHCNHDYGNSHVDAWVSAALGLKVSSLTLSFHADDTGVSVEGIFQCETLEDLICCQHYYVEVPGTVFLPNLTQLYLAFVKFSNSESFDILLSGCPVLERLSLDSCVFLEWNLIFIHSPSLKFLMLNNCDHDEYYEVDIDAPLLEALDYNDNIASYWWGMEFNSLLIASIDVGPSDYMVEYADDDEDVLEYNQNVAKLVAACRNVGCLKLSMHTVTVHERKTGFGFRRCQEISLFNADYYVLKALHLSSFAMPTFENLTELDLDYLDNHGWEFLPHMLNSAPKLDTLVLRGFMEDEGGFTKFESSILNCVPACLCLHLHTIYFEDFSGEQDELELVSYFLTNAEVLRDVEFSFCSSLPIEKQYSTWLKLKLLQRGSKSKNCKIHFANVISMLQSFLDNNLRKKKET